MSIIDIGVTLLGTFCILLGLAGIEVAGQYVTENKRLEDAERHIIVIPTLAGPVQDYTREWLENDKMRAYCYIWAAVWLCIGVGLVGVVVGLV